MGLLARLFTKSSNTLQGRFFKGIAILIFLGGLFSTLPLLIIAQNQREADAFIDLNEVLLMQNEVVSNWIDELARDINYLSELPEASYEDKKSFHKKLDLLQKNRNAFFSLFYADPSGDVIFNTRLNEEKRKINVYDTQYFQANKKGYTYTEGVRTVGIAELPAVIFSSPITNENGRFGGILGGIVLTNSIQHVVSDFALGETGTVYLADRSGTILSASKPEFPHSLKNTAIFQDALADKTRLDSYKNVNGTDVIGQYTWINQDQWVLISEVSVAEVKKPFYDMLLVTMVILLFVFFLSLIVIQRFIEQITEPIKALVKGTAFLRKGHYRHRINEKITARSVKEFRELHDAYNQMAEDLEKQYVLREQAEKEMQRTHNQLLRLSLSDGLTGIGNRRYFDETLKLMWEEAAKQKKPIALLLLDIDFFKKYNDRYGHIAGDKVLRLVAEAVDSTVKKAGAAAARYGGEELAVIIPPGASADEQQLARQIHEAVQQLGIPHLDAPAGFLSVSIGTASIQPASGTKSDQLIQQADQALYHSKRQGRAQTTSFELLTP